MSTLKRAIEIASEAHAGQLDKGGKPYIDHPLRVMAKVEGMREKTVAVLHDVVEDCPDWTLGRLRAEGFDETVINAVNSVTRRQGETYGDFVQRAGENEIGRVVKIADLLDNSDLSRVQMPTGADQERLMRYRQALLALNVDL